LCHKSKNKAMKTFGKKSFSSSLKVIIIVSLGLEIFGIIGFIGQIIFQCLPAKYDWQVSLIYVRISDILFWSIAFLVTLQLKRIIGSFKNEILFDIRIVKWLKNISYLFLLYFSLNFLLSLFIPTIVSNYRLFTLFKGVDLKILFLSPFIYLISQVFMKGCELQDQSNLTI